MSVPENLHKFKYLSVPNFLVYTQNLKYWPCVMITLKKANAESNIQLTHISVQFVPYQYTAKQLLFLTSMRNYFRHNQVQKNGPKSLWNCRRTRHKCLTHYGVFIICQICWDNISIASIGKVYTINILLWKIYELELKHISNITYYGALITKTT